MWSSSIALELLYVKIFGEREYNGKVKIGLNFIFVLTI